MTNEEYMPTKATVEAAWEAMGEGRFVAWLAEHDAEERAKRPDRDQVVALLADHPMSRLTNTCMCGRQEIGGHPRQAHAAHIADALRDLFSDEYESRETEVVEFNDGPAFRSKGMVHTLTVAPTPSGWLVTCEDFHGESSCNLPYSDAIKLAQMLCPGKNVEETDNA